MSDNVTEAQRGGWIASGWRILVEEMGLAGDPQQIRALTKGARVLALEVAGGEIQAAVRDVDLGDCEIRIRMQTLDDALWPTLLERVGEHASLSTQLLEGVIPAEAEALFVRLGVSLVPRSMEELTIECGASSDPALLRRPLLVTMRAFGEMLQDDPWLLLQVRGRTRNDIVRVLREQRSHTAKHSAVNGNDSRNGADRSRDLPPEAGSQYPAESARDHTDLEAQIDHFWGNSKTVRGFTHHISPPLIELALLRRLGPLATEDDPEAIFYDVLTRIYANITDAAIALAFANDVDENSDSHPSLK